MVDYYSIFANGFDTSLAELTNGYPGRLLCFGFGAYIAGLDRKYGLPVFFCGDLAGGWPWAYGYNMGVVHYINQHGAVWNALPQLVRYTYRLPQSWENLSSQYFDKNAPIFTTSFGSVFTLKGSDLPFTSKVIELSTQFGFQDPKTFPKWGELLYSVGQRIQQPWKLKNPIPAAPVIVPRSYEINTRGHFNTHVCSTGFSRNPNNFRLKAVLRTVKTVLKYALGTWRTEPVSANSASCQNRLIAYS